MTPLLPLALLVLSQVPSAESVPVPEAVKGITAREIGGHMRFLASDLMRGRDTGSTEIRIAADYLATRLYTFGAEPGGDEADGVRDYFAKYPIEVVTPQADGTGLTILIDRNDKKQELVGKLGGDFFVFPNRVPVGEIEAPVVFANYGLVDEAAKLDDYDGLDVKDKFVLVYAGPPKAKEGQDARALQRASFRVVAEAVKRGAVGVLNVQAPGAEDRNRSQLISPAMVSNSYGRPAMSLGSSGPGAPNLNLANSLRDEVFKAVGSPEGPEKPGLLEGVRIKFTFAAQKETKDERNVIGWFPGSDPEKKKEVVIYSAHYDHVGVMRGEIYNGSDDNASGTSTLLELAQAFGEGPRPARTVAFLWVSGEEKGLWGSQWFSNHPTLPEGYKLVADINLDMVSRNDGKQVGVTPSPKHPDYSTLIPAAQAVAQAEGLEILFNADQFYGRTDSFNFAAKGIPVIFFFSGIHEDYHKPTDDFAKADFDKAARIARTAYRLGWQVAQAGEAPKKIPAEPAAEAKKAEAGNPGR